MASHIDQSIAQNIIEMRDADLELRGKLVRTGELFDGYNQEMEAMHNRNADALDRIVESIGYPTAEKVGREASEAAWLVIQHSISRPGFMRKCARLLETAVSEGRADAKHLAYLTDRIAVYEGRPQLYGTHFDWNENGEMGPASLDDVKAVNERRQAIGLNSIEEQTKIIREQVIREGNKPPANIKERNEQADRWRSRVGWI